MEQAKQTIINFVVAYGFQILGALIILAIGLIAARWLGNMVQRWLVRKQLDQPVRSLIVRVVQLLVLAFTLVMALEKFGVNIAALVAGIGVAGVGVGLAMQGVLGNLVAGLTIIFTKPFRIGEYVELAGVDGQVELIELFSTTLVHGDRSRVVIPNRKIVGEILHNYGIIRQLDLKVGVAYGTDLSRALSIMREVLNSNPRVLQDPRPVVGTAALAEFSIVIAVKPWVALADYGPAQAEINQAILERYRENQIQIALPQREVRFLNNISSGTGAK
ncbi:MAG: mechanosensitive ion channel domain-containing protein [Verrucomicrobiota bacterium]